MGTIRELIDQAQLESTVKAARKEIEGWRDTQFWKIISKALDEQAKEIKRLQAWAEHVEEVGNQVCAEKNAELDKLFSHRMELLEIMRRWGITIRNPDDSYVISAVAVDLTQMQQRIDYLKQNNKQNQDEEPKHEI